MGLTTTLAQIGEGPTQVLLAYAKTPCHGRCPVFELKVYSDGSAEYWGKNYAPRMGHFKAQLTENQLREWISRFEEADFWSFSPVYPNNGSRLIDELPVTNTSFLAKGREKRIAHQYDGPAQLRALESFIDKEIELLTWRRITR